MEGKVVDCHCPGPPATLEGEVALEAMEGNTVAHYLGEEEEKLLADLLGELV